MKRYTVDNSGGMPTLKPAPGLDPTTAKKLEEERIRQQQFQDRVRYSNAADEGATKPIATPMFSGGMSPFQQMAAQMLTANYELANRRAQNDTRDVNIQAQTMATGALKAPSEIKETEARARTTTPEELAAMSEFAKYLRGGAEATPGQTTVAPAPQLGFGGFGMQEPIYRTRSTIGGTTRGLGMGAPLSAWDGM